jgi:hypothetical protein
MIREYPQMGLPQVLHVHHQRQPDLAGWGVRRPAFVHEPSPVLRFEAADPRIDRGAGHMQEAADAHLLPAVITELDDLEPRLVAFGMGVVVPQLQVLLAGDGTLLLPPLDRLVINGVPHLDQQDAGQFPIVEPVIEGFEPINLLPHGFPNPGRPPPDYHLDIVGEQP